MLHSDKVLLKGICQMYKVREPRKLTVQRDTLLPKEQPLESETQNKARIVPSAQSVAAEKLRQFHAKRKAAVKESLKFRWIKIGYAAEQNPQYQSRIPEREAMLYMCYPVADEKNSYSAPDWDKVSFRLEIYDYRPGSVLAHKLRNKIQDTPLPNISANRIETLATAYEFDANGQHSQGYGVTELIGMPVLISPTDQAKFIENSEIMDAIRRDFKFSLTCAKYTDGSDIHSEHPEPKQVFALSLRGPMGKINKDYAVPRNNKLCNADTRTKTFFRPSEPIDFLSIVKAYNDKFIKK